MFKSAHGPLGETEQGFFSVGVYTNVLKIGQIRVAVAFERNGRTAEIERIVVFIANHFYLVGVFGLIPLPKPFHDGGNGYGRIFEAHEQILQWFFLNKGLIPLNVYHNTTIH